MGGYGSGRTRGEKALVEDCLVLSVGTLQRDKLLLEGLHASGALTWTNTATGEKLSSIRQARKSLPPAPPFGAIFVRTPDNFHQSGIAPPVRPLTQTPLQPSSYTLPVPVVRCAPLRPHHRVMPQRS
jgi:hypothetical protein